MLWGLEIWPDAPFLMFARNTCLLGNIHWEWRRKGGQPPVLSQSQCVLPQSLWGQQSLGRSVWQGRETGNETTWDMKVCGREVLFQPSLPGEIRTALEIASSLYRENHQGLCMSLPLFLPPSLLPLLPLSRLPFPSYVTLFFSISWVPGTAFDAGEPGVKGQNP